MKNKLQPNDLPLLAKIFNPNAALVYVLTSLHKVNFYKKIQDKLDCKIQFFTAEITVKKALEQQDGKEIVFINLENKPSLNWLKDIPPKLVLIDFGQTKTLKSIPTFEFDFISNRDHTIRWIYEAKHQKPIFLNLYNASGWKGQLFKAIFKIGFSLKRNGWR